VTPSLKIAELVKNHTTFAGPTGLFTQTFALVMNRASYDQLPPDLKAVIDKNAGVETAALFGRAMDDGDKAGLEVAKKAGNNIVTLDAAETKRWQTAAMAVEADWIKEVQGKNMDGAKLVSEARALIAKQIK
jgi:TRAP-type transport system periplasmic protein